MSGSCVDCLHRLFLGRSLTALSITLISASARRGFFWDYERDSKQARRYPVSLKVSGRNVPDSSGLQHTQSA